MKELFSALLGAMGFVGVIILIIAILALSGGLTLEYSLEYWMSLIQRESIDIGFGKCMIGGIFLSGISIPVGFVTWILDSIVDNKYYIPN